jgi:exopolysaccharide biosynthesis polyprenyl glycosylphosphotransferase
MTPAIPHRRSESVAAVPRTRPLALLSEALFRDVLIRERKRADRSNRSLAVVLVEVDPRVKTGSGGLWAAIIEALSITKRDTDALGWFQKGKALGILLPEVSASDAAFFGEVKERIARELTRRLSAEQLGRMSIRLHMHAAAAAAPAAEFAPVDPIVTAGSAKGRRQATYDVVKRGLDVVLSAILLALLSPLIVVIAALVKLSSPGPVFFRQERIGQMMKPFGMLKFRTMRVDADHAIHHQFVTSFIKSSGRRSSENGQNGFFKIANDPRVTTIGRILRRTSLDELPQLWNVLRGDMSLVGPRPPLQYEVEQYQAWHKRRVLEAKPGVTGLWQVTGRSRTTFDEMVRLDLRYARSYSAWTDIKILLATPRAVISGKGAC